MVACWHGLGGINTLNVMSGSCENTKTRSNIFEMQKT